MNIRIEKLIPVNSEDVLAKAIETFKFQHMRRHFSLMKTFIIQENTHEDNI